MATYRKRLTDEDGNTIIPAVGDVYGQVYTASISSSDSTTVTYEFTPECGLMTNSVYAVSFPAPTANLTKTLLLTDGNITAASVLLPPPFATYQPTFALAKPSNINGTEPWLLMYNGTQWVCLNNKYAEEYSTMETKTSGIWVDGSPIYRKVINFGALPNATTKTVDHNITGLSTVINVYGVANYANGVALPLSFAAPANNVNAVGLNLTSTGVQITAGTDRSTASAYIVIEYTKSS